MQWFKHMTNMRHDVKMRRLINKFGIEGYGLYCAIVESIVESMDTDNPIPDLEENSTDIATMFKMDTVKVEEIMFFCIEQGLFDQDEFSGHLVCHKVYKFLETSQTRSTQMREMIKGYKSKKTELLPQNTPSQPVRDKCEEKNRKEENRIEKEEDGCDRFDTFWNAYDKKVSKDKCFKKFKKLSIEDQNKIIDYIPQYVQRTPDKQYRKNPETFLNNRSWEDELPPMPNSSKQNFGSSDDWYNEEGMI